jgi:hypothetical protein
MQINCEPIAARRIFTAAVPANGAQDKTTSIRPRRREAVSSFVRQTGLKDFVMSGVSAL